MSDIDEMVAALEVYLWDGVRGRLGFDVGANTGQSAERMLARFEHVVSWEPAVESFTEAAAAHGEKFRVRLVNAAVSDHDGTVTLDVCPAPIQSGQLTTPGMDAALGWGDPVARRVVPCTTLDTAAQQYGVPDFIKVDTEGHEREVLAGATGLLAGRRPRWLVEFHSAAGRDECTRLLKEAGYVVETVRPPQFPPGSHMGLNYGWLKAAA